MNYPIWALPSSGLLIAGVAILHVIISHFAVGGGLFLVLTERRARRRRDAALLAYVRRHSRFFILLTLVLGALTGVGIWFTIGLVQPQATSTLINTFVWGWAIEWTFFVTEIAAAMVYYYGWDRLDARVHQAVGWVYFWAAWLSLVVINGILTFMLTPGGWLETRGFWDGFFNPTFLPGVVLRTAVAVGLAGLYALVTAAWLADGDLKARLARLVGARWVLPAVLAVPPSLAWYLAAAAGAGVPVAEILGAGPGPGGATPGIGAALAGLFGPAASGYPPARRAALALLVAALLAALLTALIVSVRAQRFGRVEAVAAALCAFVAFGAGEWVREDLRKPYVIGQHLFVNGVRRPPPAEAPAPPGEWTGRFGEDRFAIDALNRDGVLAASPWVPVAAGRPADPSASPAPLARERAEGEAVFAALCSACHTTDGYLAIRPLVRGKTGLALETLIGRLAEPSGAGAGAAWSDPHVSLRTWRGRRMPPFAGTAAERHSLAVYLASLGGSPVETWAAPGAGAGQRYFEEHCAACHGPGADFPIAGRGRTAGQLYEMIGRLAEVNDMMPAFEGTDADRRTVADYLARLPGAAGPPGEVRR